MNSASRLLTPSFVYRLRIWVRTVSTEMSRWVAIACAVLPRIRSFRTRASALVSRKASSTPRDEAVKWRLFRLGDPSLAHDQMCASAFERHANAVDIQVGPADQFAELLLGAAEVQSSADLGKRLL